MVLGNFDVNETLKVRDLTYLEICKTKNSLFFLYKCVCLYVSYVIYIQMYMYLPNPSVIGMDMIQRQFF